MSTRTPGANSMTVLVTGATAGIGFATAAGLARLGHRILVTGRDEERGRAAADELRGRSRTGDVRFLRADHSSVGGNLELAATVGEQVERLDMLVNNVGCIYSDRWQTADGYEGTLAMNFVGPVTLTRELERLGRRAVPAWRFVWPLVLWFQRRASPEKAAKAPIHAASAAELAEASSGTYYNEDGKPESLPASATNPRNTRRAWALAESLAMNARSARDPRAGAGSPGLVNGDLGSDVGDASPRRVRIEAALVLTSAHGASPAGV
jgi:NAD(P)-dependent dehydrogenase (short-subunit alcohol dehydrogenase family)